MTRKVTGILFLFLLLSSCFEPDRALPPYESVYDLLKIEQSIYNYQIYVDLESGKVLSSNQNSEWLLEFECGPEGYQIRPNTSDYWEAARTGSNSIDSVFDNISGYNWTFDKSDGDPDSTVFHRWVKIDETGREYSREVYLLGKFNGIGYSDILKVQFIAVDDRSYTFAIGAADDPSPDTITVQKNNLVNFVQYSRTDNATRTLEPEKDEWELLFCQYKTILYTDDGIPAPYYVRGVLLNPSGVSAALDSVNLFDEIDYALASGLEYSTAKDAIGYDWKSVKVDESSNSAEYQVRPGYTYLIKKGEDQYFKIRFISYLGDTGVKGYPSFEYVKIEP